MSVVLFSGGADSATLLTNIIDQQPDVRHLALSFDYGQTHRIELDYARRYAAQLGVEHVVVPLRDVFACSALTGDVDMPHGHYTDATMQQTVVPNRNMVMLSIAASFAIQRDHGNVAYAAHRDDHGTYPDCRASFIDAMRATLAVCHYRPIGLLAPFLHMRKADIIRRGRALGIDYSQTWSCYAGGAEPCGKCGACSARQTAMELVA